MYAPTIALAALLSSATTSSRALSLAEAISLAISTEPVIDAARIARERAELALHRAQLDRVSLAVDAQLQEIWNASELGRDSSMSALFGLSNLSANLNVPLFTGSRISATIDRADLLAQASAADLAREKNEVARAVARAYWSIRKISLLAAVQTQALERLRHAEDLARARVDAGLAAPIDQNRARSRRLQQEATLADLQGQLREASAELATILGLSEEITLTDAPVEAPEPPPVAELIERATAERPELRAAALRAGAERENIRIAESEYYPQLGAYALLQAGNNPLLAGAGSRAVQGSVANPFSDLSLNFQGGLVLSINLFDTFHTRDAVEDARLAEQQLVREHRRLERVVESEVRRAREKVIHHLRLLAKLRPAELLARDNVDIIQKRYQNGEALLFDFLDAELELLEIERQLEGTTADLQLAELELEAALGRPGDRS